jgi:hypothetical protein
MGFNKRLISQSEGFVGPDDGRYVVAVGSVNYIHSTDYGETYSTITNLPNTNLKTKCAVSGDGQYIGLFDSSGNGSVLSTDGGSTYGTYSSNYYNFGSVATTDAAFSQTGEYQIISTTSGCWVLKNYGSQLQTQISGYINCVAISTTGQYMLYGQYNGGLYLSSNYGQSFSNISSNAYLPNANWNSVGMSEDGQRIHALVNGTNYQIRTTSGGTTWDGSLQIGLSVRSIVTTGDGQYWSMADPWASNTVGERFFSSTNYGASFFGEIAFFQWGPYELATSLSGSVWISNLKKRSQNSWRLVKKSIGTGWSIKLSSSDLNYQDIKVSRSTQ